MSRRLLLSILGLVLLGAPGPSSGWGGEPEAADPRAAYLEKEKAVYQAFEEKAYERALALCQEQIKLQPRQSGPHYNLACAQARLGRKEDAFASLATAVKLGFYDGDHMQEDEDLAALRQDARFAKLVQEARTKESAALYDKGEELKGVRTSEASPEGGLRYRLRLGEKATPEKPHRLIIWLHPSGGSMNRGVEMLAPGLAERGYALLAPTQKSWLGWSDADARKLLEKTLPHAAQTPGLDARRPLLFGFSAGGQLALELYYRHPGRFGGLILDAAYPLDAEKYRQKQVAAHALPDDPAVKTVPIFAIVGGKDGGVAVWKKAQEAWSAGGVPLTLRIVPDKGHAWLFGKPELEALSAWLGQVAAGQLPNASQVPEPDKTHPPDEGPRAQP